MNCLLSMSHSLLKEGPIHYRQSFMIHRRLDLPFCTTLYRYDCHRPFFDSYPSLLCFGFHDITK